jgi:hypothetical protein
MSGTIEAGAPWAREGLRTLRHQHPELVHRIEAAIPDGHRLVLAAGGKSGTYGVWVGILLNDAGEVARSPESLSRSQALEMALYAGRVAANA